jgi:hypothetical protein
MSGSRSKQGVRKKTSLKKELENATIRFEKDSHWALSLTDSYLRFSENCTNLLLVLDELRDLLAARKIGSKGKAKIASAMRKLDDYNRDLAKQDGSLTVWDIQSDMKSAEFHLDSFWKILEKYRKSDR